MLVVVTAMMLPQYFPSNSLNQFILYETRQQLVDGFSYTYIFFIRHSRVDELSRDSFPRKRNTSIIHG